MKTMTTLMAVALIAGVAGIAAVPPATAHIEACVLWTYVSHDTNNRTHVHHAGCDDPEDPPSDWIGVVDLPDRRPGAFDSPLLA